MTLIVAVDHFILDGITMFHAMDVLSRFSACYIVPDVSVHHALVASESCWLSQSRQPVRVQGDQAFNVEEFPGYLKMFDVKFNQIPSRRHSKNPVESKHRVIRNIFLHLKSAFPHIALDLLAYQAVRVSNDLYGTDVLFAFELAKGFSKPLSVRDMPKSISNDLRNAHATLIAKR